MLPTFRILPRRSGLRPLTAAVVLWLAWAAGSPIRAQEPTCADCHDVDTAAFETTVHGSLSCTDCHAGAVEEEHTAETARADCAACHQDAIDALAASSHGTPAFTEISGKPACQTCHGPNRILSHIESGSPVFASNVPEMTCGRCHGDVRLNEKYGLQANVVSSFQESFHGLAGRSGRATVANCSSCHGVHDILPSADPRSHIHKSNLAETCGSCHPGAGERFAIGPIHNGEANEKAAVYWIRRLYLWLIWGVIGGMVLHNVLDLRRKVLSPVVRPVVPVAQRRMRMGLGFRIAHAMMALSFIVLAYTGFALKYPEAWWATPIVAWEDTFGLRGLLHRIAAVVMLLSLGVHGVHMAIDRRARACIKAMLPNRHDVRELRERIAWFFGRRAEMPKAPPLGYIEKAEYLSLMWGTVVMAITGFLLWFENFTLRWLPTWVVDVSTAIHFYEAVLATLAILVWHFYSVMLDPLVYPMDTAWLHGREAPGRTLERTDSVVAVPPAEAKPRKGGGDPEPAKA